MPINIFDENEIVSRSNVNQRISDVNGDILYSSELGTQSSITLDYGYNLYDSIKIFFRNDMFRNSSVSVDLSYSNTANLSIISRDTSSVDCSMCNLIFNTESPTSVSFSGNGTYTLYDNGNHDWFSADGELYGLWVTKIIGYVY